MVYQAAKSTSFFTPIATWTAPSILASSFSGLIALGVFELDGQRGLAGWRWLFIIQGSLTIFFAMLSAALLPDYPRTTRWLSREEQAFAEWRLAQDVAGAVDSADAVPLLTALRMALTDYRAYLFVVMQHCNLLSQAFTYFVSGVGRERGVWVLTGDCCSSRRLWGRLGIIARRRCC